MISSTKNYRSIKKSALIGYISLSLSVSGVFASTAFAGPADDPYVTTQPAGPGQGPVSGQTTPPVLPPAGTVYINPNFYDLPIPNQVVNPVDKYSYEQMEMDLINLNSRYPGRLSINAIGQSLDGRTIYDAVIGNPNAPKKIMIQGSIHAREYITVPVMMQQLEYLLAAQGPGYYHDQSVAELLNNVSLHFIPMSNPDGVALSQFGESALRSQDLRNMVQACYAMDAAEGRTSYDYAQYLARWKSNARGVDLNHNFDAGWASLNPTLSHNSSSDYKGTAPLSEPEAQALANLTNTQNFSAVINYHAMGNVLYWDTANNQKREQSLQLAQLVSSENGYQILNSAGVGGLKDWLQQRNNSVAGITIELGRSAAPVSFSEYPALWQQNKAVPAMIIEYVLTH